MTTQAEIDAVERATCRVLAELSRTHGTLSDGDFPQVWRAGDDDNACADADALDSEETEAA